MIWIAPLEQFQIERKSYWWTFLSWDITWSNLSWTLIILLFWWKILEINIKQWQIVPSRWQLLKEWSYNIISTITIDNLGTKGNQYKPFLYTLFIIILLLNIIGIIPYTFASTSQISITFGFSLIIWLGVTIIGLINYQFQFLSLFIPPGAPIWLSPLLVLIELLSYIARAISLGVRLAANVTSGHILIMIIGGITFQIIKISWLIIFISSFPISILVFLTILELGVSFVQAYVFVLLTTIYLKDSIELH